MFASLLAICAWKRLIREDALGALASSNRSWERVSVVFFRVRWIGPHTNLVMACTGVTRDSQRLRHGGRVQAIVHSSGAERAEWRQRMKVVRVVGGQKIQIALIRVIESES